MAIHWTRERALGDRATERQPCDVRQTLDFNDLLLRHAWLAVGSLKTHSRSENEAAV
jgi:hypothetical protein